MLFSDQAKAEKINFISQPFDSSITNSLIWQSPNQYRQAIILDGSWEFRTSKKNPWQKVKLPAGYDFEGEIVFQRFFETDSSLMDHSFRLICYGINYYCDIFINNKLIGNHTGGYTSFFIDFDGNILFFNQQNKIEIKVNSKLDVHNTIPSKLQPNGFKETFGIFRSLYFLAIPEISIDNPTVNYHLNPDFSTCETTINFELKKQGKIFFNRKKNQSQKLALKHQIELFSNETGELIFKQSKKIDDNSFQLKKPISFKFILKNPNLWSPETPYLYSLRIRLLSGKEIVDQLDISMGIKQLDFFNGTIFLNGENYYLKGVNWVEDYLIDGAVFRKSQLIKDLLLIKELNANAIRIINHPAHPFLVSLCDSLGLFLLQDLPVSFVPPSLLGSNKFNTVFQNYLSETIFRDQSCVSTFAFGIGGNYLQTTPGSTTIFEELTKKFSSLENIHLYTYFSPILSHNKELFNINCGVSIFNFRKEKIKQYLPGFNKNSIRPCFVFSYGAPKYANRGIVENDIKFQKHQVQQIVDAWQIIQNCNEIDGCFITALADYYGNYPSMIYGNTTDSHLIPVGLVDHQRNKRFSFATVKSFYRGGNYPTNPDIDFAEEKPYIFPLVGLSLLILLLFAINNRRYFRENFKRIFSHPHGFYIDLRDGRKIPYSHTLLILLFITGGSGLVFASILFFLKQMFVVDHLLALLIPNSILKNYFDNIVWQPEILILFFSILILLILFCLSLLIRLIALLSRKRFTIGKAILLSFWSGANFVVYIPLGMILFRLLQYKSLMGSLFLFIIIINLWFAFRVIKGMRVVFSWTNARSIFIALMTIFVLLFGILYYYQINYGFVDYLNYYYAVYKAQLFSTLF